MQKRGIGLRSLLDGIDPSTPAGRLQLGLFATLAEYERELINERVRAGVMAAQARGVKLGQKPVDQETVETKLEVGCRLLSKGKAATRAAETVGWSRATLYRHLKERGAEAPPSGAVVNPATRGRSGYGKPKVLPSRPRGKAGTAAALQLHPGSQGFPQDSARMSALLGLSV